MRRMIWVAALLLMGAAVFAGCAERRLAPNELTRRREIRSGEVIWRVKTDSRVVALTLDDGPDPKFTPTVLQLARQKRVKFTFFLVGTEIQDHPALAKEEAEDGHAIGNHTWNHAGMAGALEVQDISEIERCEEEIEKICGERTHLFRPPKGMWDADTFLAAEKLGYRMILWSVTLEHHTAKTPEAMAQRVLDQITPGMIILAHDGESPYDRTPTMKALPLLVDGLLKKGYRFVTIPELLQLGQQSRRPDPRSPQTRRPAPRRSVG